MLVRKFALPSKKRKSSGGRSPAAKRARVLAAFASMAPRSGRGLTSRKLIGSRESGYVDLASASYALDTTGSITLIATIAQGTSVNQRIGKKAMLKSIQCRGFMFQGTTATVNDVAYLIVYDRRPTGSLPVITDVLVSANSQSMNNDTNSGRFKILKRVDVQMAGNSTTPATGQEIHSEDWFLKVNRRIIFKAAGTGAIGDIEEGALYLITVGQNVAGTAAATLSVSLRTRFVDY